MFLPFLRIAVNAPRVSKKITLAIATQLSKVLKKMTENEYELVKKKISEIKDIADLRQEKYFNWLRNIITISVGLLGIIISLKVDKSENIYQQTFFIITILSLALGILCGAILLYSEMHVLDKIRRKKEKYLLKVLDGTSENFELDMIGRSFFYDVIAFFCFSSYIISLISLVLYAIFIDI